jgi:hypothetical protein
VNEDGNTLVFLDAGSTVHPVLMKCPLVLMLLFRHQIDFAHEDNDDEQGPGVFSGQPGPRLHGCA